MPDNDTLTAAFTKKFKSLKEKDRGVNVYVIDQIGVHFNWNEISEHLAKDTKITMPIIQALYRAGRLK